MRLYRCVSAGAVSGAVMMLASSTALGQAVSAEASVAAAPAGASGETAVGAAPAEEVPAPDAAPVAEEAPAPVEETPVAETPAEEPVVEEAVAEDAVDEEGDDPFSYMFFGDAYATIQTGQVGLPAAATTAHRAYASGNYDGATGTMLNENGFSLNFAGLDLAYAGKGWGVTTSLRFGPGVTKFYAADPILGGLGAITQAFVTWAPTDTISLDFGEFGTIFGAEVAESWVNLNYTRGALYYSMQPFWHTGLRGTIGLGEDFALKFMVVNDANAISNPVGSDLQAALQLTGSAGDLGFAVGTLQTLGTGNVFVDRFFDAVVTYGTGDLSLVFNGDLNIADGADPFGGPIFYGLSLAAGYQLSDMFGVALRGEWLDYNVDADDTELVTGTLTLDVKPVPGAENIVLRWDNRVESTLGSNADFVDNGGGPTSAWFASTIGLAIYTDGAF